MAKIEDVKLDFDKGLDDLIKIYENAQQKIIEEIKRKNLQKGSEKDLLLRQVKTILTDLYNPTEAFLKTNIEKEKKDGIKESDLILDKVDSANFSILNPETTKLIVSYFDENEKQSYSQVKEALSNAYKSLNTVLNQSTKEAKLQVLKDIASGQIQGKGAKAIERILIQKIEEGKIKGYNNYELKSVIKTTVQSTLINSRAGAIVQRAIDRGQDLLQVSTHKNPSPMCASHQGQIVSISGTNPNYNKLSSILFNGTYRAGSGIFHPNCRHSLTIYFED